MIVTEYSVGAGAYGIALDARGAVWTTLVERGEVVRLDPDGRVSRFPLGADSARPMVMTCGPDEAVWFSRGDGRIGRVDPSGSVTSVRVGTPDVHPYGICTGPDGALWYTLLAADRIGRLALDGTIEEFPVTPGGMPSMITAGPDGAVWFTLHLAGAVGRMTPDGAVTTFPVPTTGAAPVGIHAGRDAVWFADIGAGQLGRIDLAGRVQEFPLPDRASRPHAVAVTDDGDCWATLWASASVARLDRNGRLVDQVVFRPDAEPHGLAVGADGSLWVALESGQLVHVTVGRGAPPESEGGRPDGGGAPLAAGSAVPSRVAALGAELVRIHDALRAELRRLRSSGPSPGRRLAEHCLAFCTALTRHHTGEEAGAFPALAARFPDLQPLLGKMAEDHRLIVGIVGRVDELARKLADGSSAALIAELDGLSAILESHFSFEERRIRDALDALDGSSAELLGG